MLADILRTSPEEPLECILRVFWSRLLHIAKFHFTFSSNLNIK